MDMFLKRKFLKYFEYSPMELSWIGLSAIVLYFAAKYSGNYFILFVIEYIVGLYYTSKWSYNEGETNQERIGD